MDSYPDSVNATNSGNPTLGARLRLTARALRLSLTGGIPDGSGR
jgi:hypothetical protein